MGFCENDGWLNYIESENPIATLFLTVVRLNEINGLKGKEHGQYTEIKNEKEVLDLTT